MASISTIYAHGLPGSAKAELTIAFEALPVSDRFECLNRLAYLHDMKDYRTAILRAFDTLVDGQDEPVRLVGFSLGAMACLHIAAAHPGSISSVELIAPAAPLQLGHFLNDMAGRDVFQFAIKGGWQLRAFALLQGAGFLLAPAFLANQLFKSAPNAEQQMMSQPHNRRAFLRGVRHSVLKHNQSYRAELRAYVQDWASIIDQVRAPVRIWQGDADNWVPPAMSQALANRLNGPVTFELLAGLSHYGALACAMPQIANNK